MTHTHMAVHQNPQHPVAIPALFRSILNHIDAQSPEFQRMVTSSTSKVDGSKTFPQKKSHLNSSSGSLPLFSPHPSRVASVGRCRGRPQLRWPWRSPPAAGSRPCAASARPAACGWRCLPPWPAVTNHGPAERRTSEVSWVHKEMMGKYW